MDLRRVFSLKRLALLSWSAAFWNRQNIHYEVHQIIGAVKRSDTRNLTVLAKNELKVLDLPNVIYDELIQWIIWLGERILKWYERCRSFGLPWRFTREIHWTVFGTIDEAKTVEKNFFRPDVTLSGYSEIYGVYYMASTCALKDYINRNATKIIDFCRKHEKDEEVEFSSRDITFLYRSVLTLANPESLSNKEKNRLRRTYFVDIDCSEEAFMFELSLEKGYTAAAEYYWQQLNPLETEDILINEAGKWVKENRFSVDVFLFLLSKMSENEREPFFGDIAGRLETSNGFLILFAIIESCGWEDLFFPVFYQLEDLNEHEDEYYYIVLNRIISVWKSRLTVGLDAKNPVYKKMFLAVLGKLKISHSENHHYDRRVVPYILQLFDMDAFNVVLEKCSFRQEFLELEETRSKDLLMGNQFGFLREFVDTVVTSPNERESFKSAVMANFDDIIRKHNFYAADYLLNWLSLTKEERQSIKFKFDFLSLCAEYFVNKNFTSATELITWGFSNEQEKDQYINSIVSSDLDWLQIIWSWNKNDMVTRYLSFYSFFSIPRKHMWDVKLQNY